MGASEAGPLSGLVAQLALLALIALTAGLGAAGWLVGVACAVTMAAALARGIARDPDRRLALASWVTLTRATLAVGVAALAADSFAHDTPVGLLVGLAAVALALDVVDGWLARRTGTATPLGARFDGEVDAFLILALSVYVAPEQGAWVLLIGIARYLFLAGEWMLPWMRAPLPPRRWRKLVAAMQGVVLTVAAAEVLPRTLTQALLAAALVLLAASMAECVWWLWRRPHEARGGAPKAIAVAITALALLLVWAALVAPNEPSDLNLGAFARLPLELVVVVALAALLPATPRRVLAVIAGVVLGLVVLMKALDIGFFTAFDRPFKPIDDSGYLGIGIETLRNAIGGSSANLVVAVGAVVVVALLTLPALALLRVTRIAAGHRDWALRAATVLGVLWVALRIVDAPVASSSAAAIALDKVEAVQTGLEDRATFAQEVARDRYRGTPGSRLLRDLRGKDVLLVFIESYGRVALEHSSISPGVGAVLDRGEAQLRRRGLVLAERLPHVADLRGPELAGALHPPGRRADRRPLALRPADREGPPHPHPRLRARRLARGRSHAGEPPRVARGQGVLRIRPRLRPPQLRISRPRLRSPADAGPVHAHDPAAARARQVSATAALRRGRPHLEPRALDEHPPVHRLGRCRRRLDLPPAARGEGAAF